MIPGFLPPMKFIGNVPKDLSAWLRDWHNKGVLIGTACARAFLLAETGLLKGKVAMTNWAYADYFKKRYPDVHLKPERILTLIALCR